MAEKRLATMLKVGGAETTVALVTDALGEVALPADFVAMRVLKDDSGLRVTQVGLDALEMFGTSYAGDPIYAVKGNTIILRPQGIKTLTAVYYAGLPSLQTNGTNWLLQKAPKAYQYAVALEVLEWAVASGKATDDGRTGRYEASLGREISDLQNRDFMARFGNARVIFDGVTP
jgi:hypothetical protein